MSLRSLKGIVSRTLSSRLGWRLFGPILRPPGVNVLMYHRINGEDRRFHGQPVETFAQQMRWIRANCDPIGLEELVERASRPRCVRPAVLVTFDDGFRDYHDHAYPILKTLGIPAVMFLATSVIDEGGMLWTDQVQWAALSTRRKRVKLPWSPPEAPAVALPDERARIALGESARAHLKTLPDTQRRAALDALLAELGDPPPRERQMLTWDEIRRTMDLTCYAGHTHTHPILSRVGSAEADCEIRTCKERITAETGRAPTAFAYPNGRPADYTLETQRILRRHGFTIAFSTSEGIAEADTDWMAVKRLAGDAVGAPQLAWLAAALMRQ